MKWVSVDERLPKIYEMVLVLHKGEIRLGELVEEAYDWESGTGGYDYWDDAICDGQAWDFIDVTHWMPLPEPPEDE